jgi:hypothetical protein
MIANKEINPLKHLQGNDLKVFKFVTYEMGEQFYDYDWFSRSCERQRMDPIITCIIDQQLNQWGGPSCLKPECRLEKELFVFLNNQDGKGYIEIEMDLTSGGYPTNVEPSSHGWPASYGFEVYSYDMKKCEVKYCEKFFRFLIG